MGVEGRRPWFKKVRCWLTGADLVERVNLLLSEVILKYDFTEAKIERYAGAIDDVVDCSLDFIVVDRHFREACLRRVRNKLRSGGLLIIDSSDVVRLALLDTLGSSVNTFVWNNGTSETTAIKNNPMRGI